MEIVILVLTVIGVIAAGAHVYYARKQASLPAPAAGDVPNRELPAPQVPACYYVLFDPYETNADLGRSHIRVDDNVSYFDETDMRPRVFILKGFTPGTYRIGATIVGHRNAFEMPYVGDLVLGAWQYHKFSWRPAAHVFPDNAHYIEISAITEELLREEIKGRFPIPSCANSPRGVSHTA